MDVISYIILILLAIWIIAAVIYLVKHRKSCSGDCSDCANCKYIREGYCKKEAPEDDGKENDGNNRKQKID